MSLQLASDHDKDGRNRFKQSLTIGLSPPGPAPGLHQAAGFEPADPHVGDRWSFVGHSWNRTTKKSGDQIVETLPAVKQAPALAGLSYSPGLRPSWRDSNPRPGEFQSVVPTAFAAKKGATSVCRTRLTAFALSRCGAMESCRHSHKTRSFKSGELARAARQLH